MNYDPQIRALLHRHLDAVLPPGSVVVDEYGGASGSVMDVAAFTTDALHAYEIKSDADSTARLAGQVCGYGRIATTATLVAGPRLLGKCLPMLPEWWGVMVAPEGGALEVVRTGRENPEQERIHIACILWAAEAEREARARGLKFSRRYDKPGAKTRLAEALSVVELRRVAHRAVATRRWDPAVRGRPARRAPRVIAAASDATSAHAPCEEVSHSIPEKQALLRAGGG